MDERDFPIRRLDHVEFYVGNAKQASVYYTNTFGFLNTAYCGFETGERDHASYVMEQGGIRFASRCHLRFLMCIHRKRCLQQ